MSRLKRLMKSEYDFLKSPAYNHQIAKVTKRVLSAALVGALSLSLFGCSSIPDNAKVDCAKSDLKLEQNDVVFENAEILPEKLDDAFYEKRWPGKKQLVWIDDTNVNSNFIVALNDMLVEKGRDYVIKYKYMSCTGENYQKELIDMKASGEQVDFVNIGSIMEGDTFDPFDGAIKNDLLTPLEDYLTKDDLGKAFYNVYEKQQWDSLTVNDHIYSYDWRQQPFVDLCVYINKNYYKKNILQSDNIDSFMENAKSVFKNKTAYQYPVIAAIEPNKSELSPDVQAEYDKVVKLLKDNKDIVSYTNGVDWDGLKDFYMIISYDSIYDASDSQYVLYDMDESVADVVKFPLIKGDFLPVKNNLRGIASWSKLKDETFDFMALIHTDADLANLLEYGVENVDYKVVDGRVVLNYENPRFLSFSPGNKWITKPFHVEPENKEEYYKNYIREHFEK